MKVALAARWRGRGLIIWTCRKIAVPDDLDCPYLLAINLAPVAVDAGLIEPVRKPPRKAGDGGNGSATG